MGDIVSYDFYAKTFAFNRESKWIETLWAAIYAENLGETAKIIFATIISHVYEEPLTFPSQRRLSEAVHKTDRTVRRAVKELKQRNLIDVPAGFLGKPTKYVIHEHTDTDLRFSPEAENMLKNLLDIQVSLFALTGDRITTQTATPDKNVLTAQEKEREEEKEEKKVTQRKEEREEEKERELEPSGSSEIASISNKSSKQEKLARLNNASTLKQSSRYGGDEARTLTEAMREPKPKRVRPHDVHQWKTVDFEKYFKEKYKELSGKALNVNFQKERSLIKKMLERTSDIEEIRDVIDFVFENWKVIAKKNDFQQFPTISLVFSQWFGTFQAMMHAGKPKSKHFIDRRSDYDFKMPKGIVRRPKNVGKTVNKNKG